MNKREKAKQDYCNRCPQKADCGYITRGLSSKCVQLQDYSDGYEKGREEVIEEACEWLAKIENGTTIVDIKSFIEDFKKAMKGE